MQQLFECAGTIDSSSVVDYSQQLSWVHFSFTVIFYLSHMRQKIKKWGLDNCDQWTWNSKRFCLRSKKLKMSQAGLRSRPDFSDCDSDSDSELEKSPPTPTPTTTPTPIHTSLFFHISKSNVVKQRFLLCNAFDAKYCWQIRQQCSLKFCEDLRASYCKLGELPNYPAVN